MPTHPAVSIIIPAYNAQEHIRECLESVLAQSFSDFEAIVVNDGSTDRTADIVREFAAKDSRILCITTGNQGLSCARNTGIDNSEGEWLFFLDSDDAVFEHAIARLHECCIKENVLISSGQWTRRQHPGAEQSVSKGHIVIDAVELVEKMLYQTFETSSAWAKLFNRSIIGDARFTPKLYYEDLDFFYRVYLKCDRIGVVKDTIYFYRQNPSSIINSFNKRRLDVLKVTARLEQYAKDVIPELLPAARDRRLSANFNMFALVSIHSHGNEYADIKAECWNIIKEYRFQTLVNPKTRLKNKLGVMLSYLGRRAFVAVSRFIYS